VIQITFAHKGGKQSENWRMQLQLLERDKSINYRYSAYLNTSAVTAGKREKRFFRMKKFEPY